MTWVSVSWSENKEYWDLSYLFVEHPQALSLCRVTGEPDQFQPNHGATFNQCSNRISVRESLEGDVVHLINRDICYEI